MSNQKKLDIASIVIILISILLILAGLFLLNKSGNKQTVTSTQVSSTSTISSKDIPKIVEAISSVSAKENSSSSVSSSSSSESSTRSSTTSISTSQNKESKASSSEAIVKVINIVGSQYEIEVLNTGYVDGKVWKVGNRFKISLSNFNADKDKEYKLSGIVENGNNSRFDLIEENK